ncbi:hypothetical protein L208DRAFT_1413464 [Tricholoma matsutake]|nr:hypothetical protein L208DRAFT_1413464 [Tricholoma matsutake 945]
MDTDSCHDLRGSPASLPHREAECPLPYQPLYEPSTTQPLAVKPGCAAHKSSLHCTTSAKSSKGNRFNTHFREQADAAASLSSRIPSFPLSHSHALSSSSGSSEPSLDLGKAHDDLDDLDVVVSSPYVKERTSFPGEKYECGWEFCRQTLVPSPIKGQHPLNTREKFQDAIERHIEDHIWMSACGRKPGKRWNCRWRTCDEILGSKRSLIRHVGAHSGFRVLCDECGRSYSRFDAFKKHQNKCTATASRKRGLPNTIL